MFKTVSQLGMMDFNKEANQASSPKLKSLFIFHFLIKNLERFLSPILLPKKLINHQILKGQSQVFIQ